jgi:hypothetical protein
MTMTNDDLNWLAAQRPARSATDKDAHDRALVSLLRHATARPPRRRQRAGFAGLFNTRVMALATGTEAAAIAAAVFLSANSGTRLPATSQGHGVSSHALRAVGAHHSTRSSLIRLADDLSTSTATGDATLIQRTTHTGGQDISVYDLYGDNGTYYFSKDESGLPSQVSGNDNQGDGLFEREVAAAKEAATGNVAQAAIDIANAPDPSRQPQLTPTNDGVSGTAQEQAKAIQAKEKATGIHFMPGSRFDNYAWGDSQDAMIAGAGDPQVRAGVLKILGTLPGVTVTQGTANGTPTLVLTAGSQEFGMNYQEQLTVNAETGMPIRFVGGAPGGAAGTAVDYQVARVTLSDVAAGNRLPTF